MNVVFPAILPWLDYVDRITPKDCRRVTLSFDEVCKIIGDYLKDMTSGVRYDRMLRQPANTSAPDMIVMENIEAANQILARFKYEKAEPFINKPLPGLDKIPADADLFETEKYDGYAADILAYLDDFDGLDVSVASKILHQKRPKLVPIFDVLARRALNIPWTRGTGGAVYEPLFTCFRAFTSHGENGAALDKLASWVNTETEVGRECQLSRVRTLDILAWSVIWYRDPFA
jgi:hypothetical protein